MEHAIIEIVRVVDTREYIEDGDRWIPIPGSGSENECARCGALHEIHATVRLEDGSLMIVGTSCARTESTEVRCGLSRGASAAKRVASLGAELVAAQAQLEHARAVYAEVGALPLPEITSQPSRWGKGRTDYLMGDVYVAGWDARPELFNRELAELWRDKRAKERGVTRRIPAIEAAIEEIRVKLDRARAKSCTPALEAKSNSGVTS